jgi:hypothetical protein
MADLAKVKFHPGDKLRDLLDGAGFKPTQLPELFERIAKANGTTVQALEIVMPDKYLWVPSDIAAELPPDRLVAVKEGEARAGDASAQRSAAIGREANEAIRTLFKGAILTDKSVGGGFEFTVTSEDNTITIVEVQTPRRHHAWTDPGSVTMTDDKTGLAGTVELNARNVAKSVRDCKAKLNAVQKYARSLEGTSPKKPVVLAEAPRPSAPPPAETAPPAAPNKAGPTPAPPPAAVAPPKRPAQPLPPMVRTAAVVGLTLIVGLGLAWMLFR